MRSWARICKGKRDPQVEKSKEPGGRRCAGVQWVVIRWKEERKLERREQTSEGPVNLQIDSEGKGSQSRV